MNMSFALTTPQICNRQKTVTRRLAWANARPGQVVQPVVKGQGIPKGGHVERINGPIRFERVHRERLDRLTEDVEYGQREVIAEGFPELTPAEFVAMFCAHNKCTPREMVTRIEFMYMDPPS